MSIRHDIPLWWLDCPRLFPLRVFPFSSSSVSHDSTCVSFTAYPFSPLNSPTSLPSSSRYPCLLLLHLSVPLLRLIHSALLFCLCLFIPLPSLCIPLLTGYWPAANCGWFVHILTGKMSTYLLKIHHTAAFCPLLSGSRLQACSHFQETYDVVTIKGDVVANIYIDHHIFSLLACHLSPMALC